MSKLAGILILVCISIVLVGGKEIGGKAKPSGGAAAGGGKPGPAGSAKLSSRKAPDDHIKQLVEQLSPDIKEKICGLYKDLCGDDSPLIVQGYKKQVVSGTNYFAAVSQKDKWFHVRIYEETWSDTLELVDVIGPKGKKDEIRYF